MRRPAPWGQTPAYIGASARKSSPLQLVAAHLDQHLGNVTQGEAACLKRRGRWRTCVLKFDTSWTELLHGKNCTHFTPADARPDAGGPRRKPVMLQVQAPMPVYHAVTPTAYLYKDALWMGLDPSARASPTTLWYVPGRTMLLSDHIDLALALGLPPRLGSWPGIVRLMKLAVANLTNVDTLMFTHHFDGNGATCHDRHPHGCCHLVAEIVALHDWRPMTCPGHPRLREGVRPRPCSCTVPQAIGWGAERDSLLHHKELGPGKRTYLC